MNRVDPIASDVGLLERLRQRLANWTQQAQAGPPSLPPAPATQAPQLAAQVKATATAEHGGVNVRV